ncbi:hypothetical protein GCE86_14705 [Micromonospora terminaliae]|uniref:Lipoprotein n=1 Tax=Micromonospora terminaliae TaxID=1914461 RepID=A0AAJ3DHX5_9ACTN|nr:hypothetical protein [Micromonospora terminaliae]NES27062.1 hypothetical protein [Micromonospora terminaliae]QGL48167.1 hypothetical protein GCE86_14705 [Micromonospora terminaliae]
MARFRRAYGAAPWHLLLLAGCFAVTGWVALRLAGAASAGRMLLWFLGAVIAHDLVLFPVYAALDRMLRSALGRGGVPSRLNHARVPALGAGLLFLVYLPGILGLGDGTYLAATGQAPRALLGRWLAVSGALFAVSALLYAARRLARRRRPSRPAG